MQRKKKTGLNLKLFEEKANKGLVWEERGQFEKAINTYDKLLEDVKTYSSTTRQEGNEKDAIIAYLLMRRAGVLLQTEKVELGEQLMHQALEYAERSDNSLIIARAKLGVGVFYGSTNRFEEGEKLLEAALLSFSKGVDYDSKQGYGWTLLNLGGLYRKQGKLDQAEQKLLEAIKILKGIENWVGVASAYEIKSKVSDAKGNANLVREDMLNAIFFYEKQGMKEKADALKKDMEKTNSS
jgi:tetratricopeptide (TPR) repeat protein